MADERFTTNPSHSPHIDMDISIGSKLLLNKNSITILEKIGEGLFGEVYKGRLHSIDNEKEHVETVAVKRLKRIANEKTLHDFLNEIDITSSFHHPNILTLVGVCPQENTSPPWMIFEYMSFGDLADVLRNSNHEFWESGRDLPTLSAEALLSISSQIAAGMEYLAAQRFVHRDLACRNCLVGSSLTVKISDFGMSREVYSCDYYKVGGKRMLPIRWMSPEGLSYGKFTVQSDVWAYGVVLWEIYSHGKQPYFGYTNEQVRIGS
ncbi:receptor protein-tyrosine kinase [Sarracenia purpurea var. burkii]